MRNKFPIVLLIAAFLSAFLAPYAEAVPTVPATGLEVQITESGKISLSADGAGSNAVNGITPNRMARPRCVARSSPVPASTAGLLTTAT
jgi:hypothetical protein